MNCNLMMTEFLSRRRERHPRMARSSYPIILPHLTFESEEAYFGKKKLRKEYPEGKWLKEKCDGKTTFNDLIEMNPECKRYDGLFDLIIWWDRPIKDASVRALRKKPKSLILSPHCGDAELSMGGHILNNRGKINFLNVVCFAPSADSADNNAFNSNLERSLIEKDESVLASRMLELHSNFFDFSEYSIRKLNSNNDQPAGTEARMKDCLKMALFNKISEFQPDDIYSPAAMGDHPDHKMIFDIVVDLFEEDFFPNSSFHFYEDIPYCFSYLNIDNFLSRFEGSYISVESWFEDISYVMQKKNIFSDVFRSQNRMNFKEKLNTIANRNALLFSREKKENNIKGAERFWQLEMLSFM